MALGKEGRREEQGAIIRIVKKSPAHVICMRPFYIHSHMYIFMDGCICIYIYRSMDGYTYIYICMDGWMYMYICIYIKIPNLIQSNENGNRVN